MHPTWPQRAYQSKSDSAGITFAMAHILFPFKCSAVFCINVDLWCLESKLFMFELSGVWRTADISRSSLMHRSIPIIVKAIVNVALSHYQLCLWLLSKAADVSTALWRQMWRFNNTVIVCPVRFFFCIMWGQNKKKMGYLKMSFRSPLFIESTLLWPAVPESRLIGWLPSILFFKGLCTEPSLAKSWPLFFFKSLPEPHLYQLASA